MIMGSNKQLIWKLISKLKAVTTNLKGLWKVIFNLKIKRGITSNNLGNSNGMVNINSGINIKAKIIPQVTTQDIINLCVKE